MDPKQLPEDKFIHEGYKSDPGTLYAWFFFLAFLMALMWGAGSWYADYLNRQQASKPFLQVTNRELSSFLWQRPEYMRINAKSKTGYLPAFQYLQKVSVEPNLADEYVIAPPETLFLYHTWHRLIGDVWAPRTIPAGEFLQFLSYCEEWQPKYWPKAPASYQDMVKALDPKADLDLRQLPETTLPLTVRIAFQGWKNYFSEGEAINQFKPTYQEASQLILKHPTFARNYWQNIEDTQERQYLKQLSQKSDSSEPIPSAELIPFLKLALFNFSQAAKGP